MAVLEILLVGILILLNGLLAMSELAVVSSRPARLKSMQEQGVPGAEAALALASDSGRFLSTVQAGITLIGIVAGAVSGATLGERLGDWFTGLGASPAYGRPMAFVLVVAAITYVSLIIGELVPKQIALHNPEALACRVASSMLRLSRAMSPFVSLLDWSGRLVLRLLRLEETEAGRVTDEEIRTLIAEAESAGVIKSGEREMIAGVMRLSDQAVRAVMTPRTVIDFVDVSQDGRTIARTIAASAHSRFPVYDGDPETIVGILQAKDVADALLAGKKADFRELVKKAPIIPESLRALEAMELLRDSSIHMGLVHDEYGHFVGIVTAADILASIAGAMDAEDEENKPVRREDGSWLIPGSMTAEEFADLLSIRLPQKKQYQTVAGLVIDRLQHLPSLGETARFKGWRLEVIDLDGRRIDKILASRLPRAHRAARP